MGTTTTLWIIVSVLGFLSLVAVVDTSDTSRSSGSSKARNPLSLDVISAPRRLNFKVLTSASVKVKWHDPDLSKGRQGQNRTYAVRYGTTSSSDPFQTVFTPHRRLTLSYLAPGVTYDLNVRVVLPQAYGPWSETLEVEISKSRAAGSIRRGNVVRKLNAKMVSSTSVFLSWQLTNRDNGIIDQLKIWASSSEESLEVTVPAKPGSFLIKNLTPSTKYTFKATDPLRSAQGKVATVVVKTKSAFPKKPRSVRLRVLNSTVLSIRWHPPRKMAVTGYKIQYKLKGATTDDTVTIETSSNTRLYRVENLQKGKYMVRLAAMNSFGEGRYSKWKSVKVLMPKKKGSKDKDKMKKRKGDNKNKDKRKKKRKDRKNKRKKGSNGADEIDSVQEGHEGQTDGATLSPTSEVKVVGEQEAELMSSAEIIPTTSGPSLETTPTDNSMRLPLSPQNLRKIGVSATTLHLAWDGATAPQCCPVMAYGLKVQNQKDNMEWTSAITGETSYLLTGLTPDRGYIVRIHAISREGNSELSQPSFFQTAKAVPPVITSITSSRVVKGKTVNITCVAEGDELPSVKWLVKDGAEYLNGTDAASLVSIAPRSRVTTFTSGLTITSSSLLLYNVTEEVEREFKCMSENSAGLYQKTINLIMEEQPSITSFHGMDVIEGTAAKLECVAKGRPLPDVSWIHSPSNSVYKETDLRTTAARNYVSSVTADNDIRHSFLVIEQTSLSQQGEYMCVATSDLGRVEVAVPLNVLVPPPPAVKDIEVTPLSPNRVSVKWLPPQGYPYAILYYQVRLRDSKGGPPRIIQSTQDSTELSNLQPNTTYFIGVTAATEYGIGDKGSEKEVTTFTNVGLEPVDVTVDVFNSTSFQVKWRFTSTLQKSFIQGFHIYVKFERVWRGHHIDRYFIEGGDARSFIVDFGRSVKYFVRVSTLVTWSFEAFSDWQQFNKPPKKTAPRPVRDLSSLSIKAESIVLKWREPKAIVDANVDSSSNQIMGYKVGVRAKGLATKFTYREFSTTRRQFELEDLEADMDYEIQVKALGRYGSSQPVFLNKKTKPLPPTMVRNATARAISSTKVHLQWEAPERGPVSRYHIRYWRPGHKDKQSAWMTNKYRNYIAGSLVKNSNYRFEVIPYNGELLGEGIVIFSRTLSDKPDGPPENVKLLALNATTLVASWTPPDPDSTNGKLTRYRLVLKDRKGKRVANFEVKGDRRNYTFLDMPIKTGYKLRVAAVNVNGTGVFSQASGISYNQEPQIPAPPENLEVKASVTSLMLQWNEPKFTGSPALGYIVGYGKFIPDVFRTVLDNSHLTHSIRKLKPDSQYLVSIRAFNSIGESKPVHVVARTKPLPLKPVPLQSPVKLMVLPDSLTSLRLSWIDPTLIKLPNVDNKRFYQIRYSSIDGETYSYINTSTTTFLLEGLKRSTIYETAVRVMRGDEISDWSMSAVNSTQQLVPDGPPTKVTSKSKPDKPSMLFLTWSPPDNPNGKIEKYEIHLTDDPSLAPDSWVVLETYYKQVTIRDLKPYVDYHLKIRAKNKAGYGPFSSLVTHKPSIDKESQPIFISVVAKHSNESASVELMWRRPQSLLGRIKGYVLYRREDEQHSWIRQFVKSTNSIVSDLDFNTTYFFKVATRYYERSGPPSDVITYSTPEDSKAPLVNSVMTHEPSPSKSALELESANGDEGRAVNDGRALTGNVDGAMLANQGHGDLSRPKPDVHKRDDVVDETTEEDERLKSTTESAIDLSFDGFGVNRNRKYNADLDTADINGSDDASRGNGVSRGGWNQDSGSVSGARKGRMKKRDKKRKRKSKKDRKKRKRGKKRKNKRHRDSFSSFGDVMDTTRIPTV